MNYYRLDECCDILDSQRIPITGRERIKGKYPYYGANGLQDYVNDYIFDEELVLLAEDGGNFGSKDRPIAYKVSGKCWVNNHAHVLRAKRIVNIDYLCYALMFYNVDYLINGATRKKLTQAAMCKMLVPKRGLTKQKEIVALLKLTEKIIFNRKAQLKQIDLLIKSRFMEMFETGTVFNKRPLAESVEEMFIGPFGSSLKNECFVSKQDGYCMVYEQKHAIKKTMDVETRYVDKAKYLELRRFSLNAGDIIVSCRGTIGEIYAIPDNAPLGIMHPSIMKIRLKKNVYDKQFFAFLLRQYMAENNSKANGSGVKMAVTAKTLGKQLFIVPTLKLQNEFVSFVMQTDKLKFMKLKGVCS